MSLGTWEPAADSAARHIEIDQHTLHRFIAFSRDERLQELENLISGDESQRLAGLMHLDRDAWQAAADPLDSDELLQLIRFFAVAENLPGWEAGDQSPVIPLAKGLRRRGERLDREFLRWLRQVNDNRFLPDGPL